MGHVLMVRIREGLKRQSGMFLPLYSLKGFVPLCPSEQQPRDSNYYTHVRRVILKNKIK